MQGEVYVRMGDVILCLIGCYQFPCRVIRSVNDFPFIKTFIVLLMFALYLFSFLSLSVVFFGLGLKINAGITDKDREESPYYQDFLAPKKEGGAHGHH